MPDPPPHGPPTPDSPRPTEKPATVIAGAVGKPFGLAGETYVFADPDVADEFPPGAHYARQDGGSVTVVESRLHGNRRLVRFEGIGDREAAEAIRGVVLLIDRAGVRLEADALWADDLIGREVVDQDGAVVGVVERTLDGPAHDYLLVARPDGGELLLPAVAELVDVDADPIVVHAIPGLLE